MVISLLFWQQHKDCDYKQETKSHQQEIPERQFRTTGYVDIKQDIKTDDLVVAL